MKKITIILLFVCGIANGQGTYLPVSPSNYGESQLRGKFQTALLIPTGCGAPGRMYLTSSADTLHSAKYYDSCGHKEYTYDPSSKAWHISADSATVACKLNITDTASMLAHYERNGFAVKYTDTASMLSKYFRATGGDLTGTGGAGYIGFPTQTTSPAAQAGITIEYRDSAGGYSFRYPSGFIAAWRVINTPTANRNYYRPDSSGTLALKDYSLQYSDTSALLSNLLRKSDTSLMLSNRLKISDTAAMLLGYTRGTTTLFVRYTDTANMLSNYVRNGFGVRYIDTSSMLAGYLKTSGGSANGAYSFTHSTINPAGSIALYNFTDTIQLTTANSRNLITLNVGQYVSALNTTNKTGTNPDIGAIIFYNIKSGAQGSDPRAIGLNVQIINASATFSENATTGILVSASSTGSIHRYNSFASRAFPSTIGELGRQHYLAGGDSSNVIGSFVNLTTLPIYTNASIKFTPSSLGVGNAGTDSVMVKGSTDSLQHLISPTYYAATALSVQYTDTAAILANYDRNGFAIKYTDSAAMLSNLLRKTDTATMLSHYIRTGGASGLFSSDNSISISGLNITFGAFGHTNTWGGSNSFNSTLNINNTAILSSSARFQMGDSTQGLQFYNSTGAYYNFWIQGNGNTITKGNATVNGSITSTGTTINVSGAGAQVGIRTTTGANPSLSFQNGSGALLNLYASTSTTFYQLILPPDAGTLNYVMTTDGSGTTTWKNPTRFSSIVRYVPTTGGNVNLGSGAYSIIDPAGSLLTLTVNLPTSPANGDVVYIKFTQAVTTVTYANGTVQDAIISPGLGQVAILSYYSSTGIWY